MAHIGARCAVKAAFRGDFGEARQNSFCGRSDFRTERNTLLLLLLLRGDFPTIAAVKMCCRNRNNRHSNIQTAGHCFVLFFFFLPLSVHIHTCMI